MAFIAVQKSKIEEQKGVVILPLKEYRKLLEQGVPTYYLKGRAAEKLDRLVENGLKEYREDKTIRADSLTAALRKYGKNRAR